LELWFTLPVMRDGFTAVYVKKVDPEKGPAGAVVLKPRPPVEDVSQVVRGRVVDARGNAVRDAVVEQQGITRSRVLTDVWGLDLAGARTGSIRLR
jgi:hypothetical protein